MLNLRSPDNLRLPSDDHERDARSWAPQKYRLVLRSSHLPGTKRLNSLVGIHRTDRNELRTDRNELLLVCPFGCGFGYYSRIDRWFDRFWRWCRHRSGHVLRACTPSYKPMICLKWEVRKRWPTKLWSSQSQSRCRRGQGCPAPLEAVPLENLEPGGDDPGRAYHHVERFEGRLPFWSAAERPAPSGTQGRS
jgi:hypothetical protein